MVGNKGAKTNPKRRTQVKDLPEQEKQLSKEEQKKVKGGEIVGDDDSSARGLAIGKGIRIRSN